MRRIAAREPLIKYGFVIPAKAGIPFPRLRGKVGWGLLQHHPGSPPSRGRLDQSFTRPSQQRVHQRGQALLVLLMILGIGFGVWFYTFVGSSGSAIERDKITTAALVQAKEALIGWSASRTPPDSSSYDRPGDLPCPDINPLDGYEDGSCVAGALGRVPWKTLGIPEPKDNAGETLWYTIAGPFRRYNPSIPLTTVPITSDTLGDITVYQDNPSTTLTTPASTATTITTRAVAVIFAPGASLGTQNRSSTDTMDCTAPSGTYPSNICASNYLETWSSVNNSSINGPFIQARSSNDFNDRLLVITNADLMPAVERRVAREMISILQRYKAATATSPTYPGGVYPWSDRSDGGSNTWNHNRFPCGTALPVNPTAVALPVNWDTTVPSSSPSTKTPPLPLWLTNGCTNPVTGWTSVIYYAVARNRLENSGAACTNCTDATLTVTNSSNSVADLCPTTGTTCSSTVVSSGSADLILITPGAATASPRGNWPAADFFPITGFFEDAENSGNNNDIYVVPSSTNYDRDHIYIVR